MVHHHGEDLRAAQSRALWLALVANAAVAAVEIAGGFVFRSLALISDGTHMVVDVGALGIALVGQRLVTRPASARHTYGLQRAEVLAALANSVLVIVVAGVIFFEGLERLGDPEEVAGAGLLAVATVGLLVNVASAALIGRHRANSLNMRGALIHMLADAAGSVAAIGAGLAIAAGAPFQVDAIAGMIIVVLMLGASWGLLRDALHVLMEGVPPGMDPGEVEAALAADPSVEAVHHLHLWNLASYTPALSAHVVLAGEVTLHEAQVRGERLKSMLVERFGIEHSTLELECHECEARPDAEHRRPQPTGPSTPDGRR